MHFCGIYSQLRTLKNFINFGTVLINGQQTIRAKKIVHIPPMTDNGSSKIPSIVGMIYLGDKMKSNIVIIYEGNITIYLILHKLTKHIIIDEINKVMFIPNIL